MARKIHLLTVAETAEILCCSEDTVKTLIKAGQLPAYQISPKITRVDEEDAYSYLESRKTKVAALQRQKRVIRPPVERICTYKPGDKVV